MPFERVPKPPVTGELLTDRKQHVPTHPDHFDSSGFDISLSQLCYGPLGNLPKLPEVERCRTAWEVGDRSVPFPDYWAGWQAATKLIDERALRVSEQAFARASARRTALEDLLHSMGWSVRWAGDGTRLVAEREQSEADACALLSEALAELEASKLREATLVGQLNAALQPTLDGEAFKKLRKENERLADALLYVADNCSDQEISSYASNVLSGAYT